VAERLKAAEVMGQAPPVDHAEWRHHVGEVIDVLIDDVLTRQYVEARGRFATPELIDAEVAKVEARYGGPDGLRQAMDQMHVTAAQLRETQRRGLYLQALIDLVVPATDARIDAYLAQPGATGLSRAEAAARVRAESAAALIPQFLDQLREGAAIQVVDITALE
jgi:hypothetical protein